MNQALVEGPIFKPLFVQWKWLAFNDSNGKDCFQSHTHDQVIGVASRHIPLERNVAYAEVLQKGTWD